MEDKRLLLYLLIPIEAVTKEFNLLSVLVVQSSLMSIVITQSYMDN